MYQPAEMLMPHLAGIPACTNAQSAVAAAGLLHGRLELRDMLTPSDTLTAAAAALLLLLLR